ncbi:Riboflavin kinase [Clostridiaceae bacterium JG1575]|nr:Riboflavin kinase [Clostridiaceae bacterium JG1575]
MIILDKNNQKKLEDQTYIALGSFDGVHKGHMALINRVVDEALLNDCKSLVYTFTNHPLTVAAPESAPKLIMDNEQKMHIFRSAGVDMVALVDFTYEYMQTSAEDFVRLLLDRYNARGLVVGFNYKFGYQNTGDVALLKDLSEQYGFELIVIDPETDEEGLISSTRIRSLLLEGKVGEANKLLIEPFMLRGTIIPGKNNGKAMGFPTANMTFDEKSVIPKEGVYYTNIRVKDALYRGITSVGKNPTLGPDNPITVETYILDFDEDIYGEPVRLYFLEWMRGMIRYDSLDELKEQLRKDNNYAATRNLAKLRQEK